MSLTKKVEHTVRDYDTHYRSIQVVQVLLFASVLLSGVMGIFLLLTQWPTISTTPMGVTLLAQVGQIVTLLLLAFVGATVFMLMQVLKKQSWGDRHLAELFAEFVETYSNPVWQAVTDVTKMQSTTQGILHSARRLLDDHKELEGEISILLEALDPAVLGRLLVQLRGMQISLEDEMRRILPQLDQCGLEVQKLTEALPEGEVLYKELQRITAEVQGFIAKHASNVTVLNPKAN